MTEIEKKIHQKFAGYLRASDEYYVMYPNDVDELTTAIAKLVTDIQAATWDAARKRKPIVPWRTHAYKYPSLTEYNNRSEPLKEKK